MNDLNKTYASLVVAIDELYIYAKTGQRDPSTVQEQEREAKLALAQINQTAPPTISAVANKCWELAMLVVNDDRRYPRDFLASALFAHVADFNWLTRAHLSGDEKVTLPAAKSAVFRLQNALKEWTKAPLGKDYRDSFMDWLNDLPSPDGSNPQYQLLKQLLQAPGDDR